MHSIRIELPFSWNGVTPAQTRIHTFEEVRQPLRCCVLSAVMQSSNFRVAERIDERIAERRATWRNGFIIEAKTATSIMT